MVRLKRLGKVYWYKALIGIVLISLSSCNQQAANGEISSDDIYFDDGYDSKIKENLPQITFEKEDFNFGIILEGEKISHTYKFKNTGKSDLILSSVEPSCGCTTPKGFTREPIPPNGEGEIKVEFDSAEKKGEIRKSITVVTNCSPNKTILYILGDVLNTQSLLDIESN